MDVDINFEGCIYGKELWMVWSKRNVLAEFYLAPDKRLTSVLIYRHVSVSTQNLILHLAVSYAHTNHYKTSSNNFDLERCKPGISFQVDVSYMVTLDADTLHAELEQLEVDCIIFDYYSVQSALEKAFSQINVNTLSYNLQGCLKEAPDEKILNCTVRKPDKFILWKVLENDMLIPDKHPIRHRDDCKRLGKVKSETRCYEKGCAVKEIHGCFNLREYLFHRNDYNDSPYIPQHNINIILRGSYIRTQEGVEELVAVLQALLSRSNSYIEID